MLFHLKFVLVIQFRSFCVFRHGEITELFLYCKSFLIKILLYGAFALLFIGIYKNYTPICYVYLPKKVLKGKLKERSGNNFLLRIKTEKKVHIYQIQAILLCLITFPAMLNNISLPGFFYQGLHAFDFFSTQQHEQLLHLAAANCHKSVVFFYVHLSHIFTRQSTFFI